MASRIGTRVFPNETSDAVLRSPGLLHFSPVPEPPIDYTIKEKTKKRPDYSVAHDVFRRVPSPDYTHEEDALRTSPQRRPRQTDRRATQVVGDVLDKRQDIWTETEMVLDDLNSTLEEAISSSQSSIPRPFNSRRRQSLERAKSLAEKGQKAQIAPVLNADVIEDLHQLTQGKDVALVNENRKQAVLEMYEKTRRLIEEAKNIYTVHYFLPQYSNRPIPNWQKQLLASKASKEMLRKYEEKAWEEFDEWKRRCAPKVQLQPDYHFTSRPALN